MFGQPVGKPWYFDSSGHTEALNRLVWVAESGEPFVLLVAEHGAGKTTVLNRVLAESRRAGCTGAIINVSALDETAFLWHLCGALSICAAAEQGRTELMAAIRDEICGRAICDNRTVVILDDLHAASEDLTPIVQFLTGISQQTDGAVTVIAATDARTSASLRPLSALQVNLPLLDDTEARDFVCRKLVALHVAAAQLEADGIDQVVASGTGSPARLTRICELIQVAAVTSPQLSLTAEAVRSLAAETLGLASVA